MFSSYRNVRVLPLETLGNGAKKQTAVGLYPTYGRYLPHFVGVKNGQGF